MKARCTNPRSAMDRGSEDGRHVRALPYRQGLCGSSTTGLRNAWSEESSAATRKAMTGGVPATFVELPRPEPTRRVRMHAGTGRRRRGEDAGPPEGHRDARPGGDRSELLEPPAMIQITPQMRILVAVEPTDFRGDRWLGPGLQGGVAARSVWRLGLRVPQPAGHGAEGPGV